MTLWQGRLGAQTAAELLAFTESLSFDMRLAPDDLVGSAAHVKGLSKAGIISSEELDALLLAMEQVRQEYDEGALVPSPDDEDVHTLIERRLTEIAPGIGPKVHTGRSRNDQVATALRLFCRRELLNVASAVIGLQAVLLTCADDAGDGYLPGYTHLQRAQPVMVAHHFMAHGWALSRDIDRLLDAFERLDVSPLGAGALAGSSLPLDPDWVGSQMHFAGRFQNSLDAVSDRDFVAEILFDLSLLGVHLSRLGEEIVLWSTEEFGFLKLADEWATGSSMLPQKKNPDIAELARGKAGRLIGHLSGFLATLKGLPLSYNRDLQEDKEPLFDALDQTNRALIALSGLLEYSKFDLQRMKQAADGAGSAAVDLAEWLVERGMPFREAHSTVGALVRESIQRHVPLSELVTANPSLGQEAAALLESGVAVTRRRTAGGGGPIAVAAQRERFLDRLNIDKSRIKDLRAAIQKATIVDRPSTPQTSTPQTSTPQTSEDGRQYGV